MSENEDDKEISFTVKFLGRVQVLRSEGVQVLEEAAGDLQNPNKDEAEKTKKKKNKVSLFVSVSGIDILEHKTKFMLYTCPLSSISSCAVHQATPKIFGFVAKHPASEMHHCYVFQSKKFSHLLVSVIGDTFQASQKFKSVKGSRDLVVEALRHKNKVLQRENMHLKKRVKQARNVKGAGFQSSDDQSSDTESSSSRSGQSNAQVRFQTDWDEAPLIKNV
ncbi:PTB domain-containing engulfment adapter protein 1-like [Denticeps clupeoides]|uniref:PTB domain-containing engulfment adapter protein 1-like n=1 Tax=Denticeps clupeoides TaxID=299321 RepID=UPI0010A53F5F|nr:PTB domain-containing engulfment adapter protein 1-like [Denticeps clupeoides]XP_028848478.1 PTB domain-containing engulfment adapter protein 1-like [Denticeps clupeoides]